MEEILKPGGHRKRENARTLSAGIAQAMDWPPRTVHKGSCRNFLGDKVIGRVGIHPDCKRYGSLLNVEGLPLVVMGVRKGASEVRYYEIERDEFVSRLSAGSQRGVQVR